MKQHVALDWKRWALAKRRIYRLPLGAQNSDRRRRIIILITLSLPLTHTDDVEQLMYEY